jgi:hypothetical protein
MAEKNPQKGAVRTGWLILGVVTCVIFGSTLNRCLTCPKEAHETRANLDLEGKPFVVAPPAGIVDKPETPEPTPAAPPAAGASTDTPTLPAGPSKATITIPEDEPASPKRKLTPMPKPKPEAKDGKYLALTFEDLASYEYKFPEIGAEAKPTDQIPASVKKYHGREIAIQGFMIPIKTEGEQVLEFVLVRNQFACCYGVVPKMNEWLHVKMTLGNAAPYALDVPITIYGKLDVGELWENGVVMSLYRLACDDVTEPPLFK